MPRPSRDLDRKLIAAARAMLPETGFSGLSVREVSRRAGINLGMFHYHFRSRKAFVRQVLQEVYEDFFVSFREAVEGPGGPRERLRRVLVAYARFARENRVLYSLMMRELLNGHREAVAFARANFPRHVEALMRLMRQCRRAGVVRPLPVPALCMFAMSTMGLPNLAVTALQRSGQRRLGGAPLSRFAAMLLCDAMIETRADMALAALAGPRAR